MKNPFRAIVEWSHRHHDSVSSFNVNFIATVLGIVLTFGTSMWYERQQKREAADALVERCLNDMEGRLTLLDKVIAKYDLHDSLYTILQTQPIDSLNDDQLGAIIFEFTTEYNLIISHAYEKSFSQSVSSHDNLGQYAEVLGDGFEYLLYAEQQHEQINKLHSEMLKRQILARNTYWDKGSMSAVVTEAIQDPFFTLYHQEYLLHSGSVRHMQDVLSFYIPEARRLWKKEITFAEFSKATQANWDRYFKH